MNVTYTALFTDAYYNWMSGCRFVFEPAGLTRVCDMAWTQCKHDAQVFCEIGFPFMVDLCQFPTNSQPSGSLTQEITYGERIYTLLLIWNHLPAYLHINLVCLRNSSQTSTSTALNPRPRASRHVHNADSSLSLRCTNDALTAEQTTDNDDACWKQKLQAPLSTKINVADYKTRLHIFKLSSKVVKAYVFALSLSVRFSQMQTPTLPPHFLEASPNYIKDTSTTHRTFVVASVLPSSRQTVI